MSSTDDGVEGGDNGVDLVRVVEAIQLEMVFLDIQMLGFAVWPKLDSRLQIIFLCLYGSQLSILGQR